MPFVLDHGLIHTTIDDGRSFPVGIPQNHPVFWVEGTYWIFFAADGEIRAKFGRTLGDMVDTPTHPSGSRGIGCIVNEKAYSVLFGKQADRWYAWAAVAHIHPDDVGVTIYRWRLDRSAGLRDATCLPIAIESRPGPCHVTLTTDPDSFVVRELYGVIVDRAEPSSP